MKIEVVYDEDNLNAKFHCPLCNSDWQFPFTARRVHGKPWPAPETIVTLHLYGAGAEPQRCAKFDVNTEIPRADPDPTSETAVNLEVQVVNTD